MDMRALSRDAWRRAATWHNVASKARRKAHAGREAAASLEAVAQTRRTCALYREEVAAVIERVALRLDVDTASLAPDDAVAFDTGQHAPSAFEDASAGEPESRAMSADGWLKASNLWASARRVRLLAENAREAAANLEAVARNTSAWARCCDEAAQNEAEGEATANIHKVAQEKSAWAQCCDQAAQAMEEAAASCNADAARGADDAPRGGVATRRGHTAVRQSPYARTGEFWRAHNERMAWEGIIQEGGIYG